MKIILSWATWVFPLWVAGCLFAANSQGSDQHIALEVVYDSLNCPTRSNTLNAQWIARPAELPALSGGIPGEGMPAASKIQWDPQTHGVLWISMGRKPTGGFGIELAQPTATLHKGVAIVQIRLHQPSPGAMVTQAFTSPCLLVKLASDGIDAIYIEDQTGQRLAQVDLPPQKH